MAQFGKAQRKLTSDTRSTAVYANAIGKEREFASRILAQDDDELDALVKQQLALRSAAPKAPPPPPPPVDVAPRIAAPMRAQHRAPMSHAQYLRSLDSTQRLLHGNIFPFASYVNNSRIQYNKQTFESMRYAHPCARQP